MKYLAFAIDDANHTMEIVIINDARNSIEAKIAMRHLIAASSNPALRPGEVYGINPVGGTDPICSISLANAEVRKSILNKEKVEQNG